MVWYASAMEHLVHVVQELSLSRDLPSIMDIVRLAARDLTGADGAAFVLRDGDNCFYAEENAISPLWKGRRFPMTSCISGWCMMNREPAVIRNIYEDPRVPVDAYRPTFVHSLAMVPIRTIDPIGAIGTYWAEVYRPSREQVAVLQALADVTAVAMENVQVLANLERLVKERTADLNAANGRLRDEIALRRKAEERARRQSLTDKLTGLNNRRGFLTLATRRYRSDCRAGKPSWLLYADVDGLKAVNDGHGHAAGDRLISRIATAFRATFREIYIVGRLGGDEFAVYGPGAHERPEALRDRLIKAVADIGRRDGIAISLSAGIVHCDHGQAVPFEALLKAADAAMYAEKQTKRG
jgi:diguanylate cyclase (GGDEF)-like protein